MAKKKACKQCKMLMDGTECPSCKSQSIATSWQGRIAVIDEKKSDIADKVGIKEKGEYALKVR